MASYIYSSAVLLVPLPRLSEGEVARFSFLSQPGSNAGAIDEDLRTACLAAVARDPEDCRRHAETFTWERCAQQFLDTLQTIPRSHWLPLRNRVLPDAAAP